MQSAQLDSEIEGVGVLITQLKLFSVPEHQRNFSWTSDHVEKYLEDIKSAMESEALEYFIGVVVLQGPVNSTWQILDGQQRLATTTMIYSAIRNWLRSRDYQGDADQIESEFIRVRQLGGNYKPRLTLNTNDRVTFEDYVIKSSSDRDIDTALTQTRRFSSNRRLLEATRYTKNWIENFCSAVGPDRDQQAQALRGFAEYIATRVKVVCLQVPSYTDAYILFESLNYRGSDLSALDLVKNYIFSEATANLMDQFSAQWNAAYSKIEGRDADDFLKVFWTSRFGIIRKSELFDSIKEKYQGPAGVTSLLSELLEASEIAEAIDDPEHELWQDFGVIARDRMSQLNILGGRQVRPVLLAALVRMDEENVQNLMWGMIVLTVRHQLIGRERAGILERFLGSLSQQIWNGDVRTADEAYDLLKTILPGDDDFREQFSKHIETKASRSSYLLAKLEVAYRLSRGNAVDNLTSGWNQLARIASPDMICQPPEDEEQEVQQCYRLLGNCVLIEDTLSRHTKGMDVVEKIETVYSKSAFLLTHLHDIAHFPDWSDLTIQRRSRFLAAHAVTTWGLYNDFEWQAKDSR